MSKFVGYLFWLSLCAVQCGCSEEAQPAQETSADCTVTTPRCQPAAVDGSIAAMDVSLNVDSSQADSNIDADAAPTDAATAADGQIDIVDARTSDALPTDTGVLDTSVPDAGAAPACSAGFGNGLVTRDIPYANESPRQRFDLYETDAPGPRPLLIWIHGGGWRAGSKDTVNNRLLAFRQRGYSIASIGYRLSDAPWPATVVDIKSAVRFLRTHAADYDLDPNRFVAMGASAGGHLVLMLGVSPNHPRFGGGPDAVSDEVQAVVNFYGPADLDQMDEDAAANNCPANALCHDCDGSPESLLLDCRPSQCTDIADEASPIDYIDGDEAPILTLHGLDDCTVPPAQGQRLHEALDETAAHHEFRAVQGAGHNLNACLQNGGIQRVQAFTEAQIRGCADQEMNAAPNGISQCLRDNCPAEAAACDTNPVCLALESCFQICFRDQLGNCIRRCMMRVPNAAEGRVDHEPLFNCGRPQGCY